MKGFQLSEEVLLIRDLSDYKRQGAEKIQVFRQIWQDATCTESVLSDCGPRKDSGPREKLCPDILP